MRITWLVLVTVLGCMVMGSMGCGLCEKWHGGATNMKDPTVPSGPLQPGAGISQRAPGMMDGQTNPGSISQTYPGLSQGNPGAVQGYPGATQGYPGLMQGNPGAMRGYPGVPQGYPAGSQGYGATGVTNPATGIGAYGGTGR